MYVISNFTPAENLWCLVSCSYSQGGSTSSHIFVSWLVVEEVGLLCCWWENEGKNTIITKQGSTSCLPGLLMCLFASFIVIPTLDHINCFIGDFVVLFFFFFSLVTDLLTLQSNNLQENHCSVLQQKQNLVCQFLLSKSDYVVKYLREEFHVRLSPVCSPINSTHALIMDLNI